MPTRQRTHDEDTPFGEWVRSQRSIDATDHGLTVNDVDFMFHKYKNNVDGLGARIVHLMMHVEIKVYNGMPGNAQLQTLWFNHQLLNQRRFLSDRQQRGIIGVWHYGCFVLSMSGTRPDNSDINRWCRFDQHGDLIQVDVSEDQLTRMLGFIDDPNTQQILSLRRHHKKHSIVQIEQVPLGFKTELIVKFES